MKTLLYLIALVVIGLYASSALSQNYQLDRYVIGSSATVASNASYSMQSTAGQPVIGKATNASNTGEFGFWYNSSFNNIVNLEITLNQSWNIISTYALPPQLLMDSIFKEIAGKILIVKNINGQIYVPSMGMNFIGDWDITQGYRVFALSDTVLKISGQLVDPTKMPIYPVIGWNLLAYLRNSPMAIASATNSLIDRDNLLIAKNGDGDLFVPSFLINDIGNMLPTQGYSMYVSAKDTLNYPANGVPKMLAANMVSPKRQYFKPEIKRTGNDMSLIVTGDVADFTEIGVYDIDGRLIGSNVFVDGKTAVTIWGDNEYTDAKDGAIDGEYLTAKITDGTKAQEVELSLIDMAANTSSPDLTYHTNSIILAKVVSKGNFASGLTLSPMPANTNLDVHISGISGEKTIDVYNLTGKHIAKVNTESEMISLDTGNYPPGEYTIIITHDDKILKDRFIVQR